MALYIVHERCSGVIQHMMSAVVALVYIAVVAFYSLHERCSSSIQERCRGVIYYMNA